jgi:hypothetical protein
VTLPFIWTAPSLGTPNDSLKNALERDISLHRSSAAGTWKARPITWDFERQVKKVLEMKPLFIGVLRGETWKDSSYNEDA